MCVNTKRVGSAKLNQLGNENKKQRQLKVCSRILPRSQARKWRLLNVSCVRYKHLLSCYNALSPAWTSDGEERSHS